MGESRTELLQWLNDLLQLNYTKIEQCGTGAAYCQVIDSIYGTHPHLYSFLPTLPFLHSEPNTWIRLITVTILLISYYTYKLSIYTLSPTPTRSSTRSTIPCAQAMCL